MARNARQGAKLSAMSVKGLFASRPLAKCRETTMNMLLVDEDKGRANRLMRYASRGGHLVSVAYDLNTALDWLIDTRFDLIILNTKFSASLVHNAVVTIREKSPSMHSRIVVVTDSLNDQATDVSFKDSLDIEEFKRFLDE
ncbi:MULTISPECIES: hypothetical protein [Burkholderia cepacia complex]|jgi:PleD family two-component response regulator|uniref:Response regulatory domain-containing protein n=1 Tax=Burkholderia vietnamiensis TaxID=60552 RepID=A0AAW7TBY8_BURVI|nr:MULTISPECIES: hypothetical protein [Burkholderia cepacia complex]MDN7799594.1 hypothetical protein [Burkholderia vietnamiensis]